MFMGPHKQAPHRPENVGEQRDIFWPVGPLYGELRHLKVELDAKLYKASGFRKPYLKSGNTAKYVVAAKLRTVGLYCSKL